MRQYLKSMILGLLVIGLALPAFAGGPFGVDKRKVIIEGSTTVLPIAQATAETFMRQNQETEIVVRGGGSGVGIASLIDRNCDIADSSRSIKDAELEKAASNKVSPKAHVVAMDGIVIVVNKSNSVNALTKKQVRDIFTGKISDWSEVGGSAGRMVVVSRDTSSGTFEAFGALVLDGQKVRPDVLMQASNQAVASIINSTPAAIGYIGLGYLNPGIKGLPIDGIIPSKETVLTGQYTISRPLFMYTDGEPSGTTKDYIDFVKSREGQAIVNEQGFVALK